MKHTVIIPLYNKEDSIFCTISSLAFQEKKPSQIVIVDDFSTDKSVLNLKDALSFFAPQFLLTTIEVIELKENKGYGNAKNIGLERANGDLISFLDADDYYTYTCLDEVNSIMEKENLAALILGILLVPSQNYLPDIKSFETEPDSISNDLFLVSNVLHTISLPGFLMGNNVVIKRKYLENIRFETAFSLSTKIDFWYRVLKSLDKYNRIGFLNKPCIEIQDT